ncbi:MAG: xanthine dehydrogenase family protein subunit M [Chloroflexi bacterium]|nr:MAG: xanthine dehydrogenase family protein subunit M [Chloroflexota bacterium]
MTVSKTAWRSRGVRLITRSTSASADSRARDSARRRSRSHGAGVTAGAGLSGFVGTARRRGRSSPPNRYTLPIGGHASDRLAITEVIIPGVSVHIGRDVDDALENLSSVKDATLLAGGTDLLVEINFGRARPTHVIVIDRLDELKALDRNGHIRMGALVTYTRMLADDPGSAALREAARTVGSPQIRNAGTLGGNLGTASPAGDTLPVLAALDATVVLRSRAGERRVKFADYMTGPKKSVRRPDEIVVAAEWDDAGPAQTFMKVGTRNAMVIAVAGLALVVDRARRRVGVGLGSCGPTILRAPDAEKFAAGLFDEAGWDRRMRPTEVARTEFGRLAAAAARPIDDVRGTAAYRRHVLAVMASRALARVATIA